MSEIPAGRLHVGQYSDTGLLFVMLDTGCDDGAHFPSWAGSVSLAEVLVASERHARQCTARRR